ncbi:universal stress protein family domain-containing protein [Coprinopsis cinerea okayama7|uniref:Universal stress protein family domain-containing protein n=1 Tax=Coprinopsis cinerea (strain Okayama-7 / 130 / ATCC MYA-4618 / FGSC 9003) TaxID=240176 RepID=A8P110_COPC7|nr:universal stress protein family domain-containing protein [Coprinopsis cinerea okayama7\|eukprot:XP_001838002.1 universal stress protein family domain-containing protein [Coprinopsis cinerea okayama7\
MALPEPPHHNQVPLRSALKNRDRDSSRAGSPARSYQSLPAETQQTLSTSPRNSLSVEDSFQPRAHSPSLLSQVPLPPSPNAPAPISLPPTPLRTPNATLPPLTPTESQAGGVPPQLGDNTLHAPNLLTPTSSTCPSPLPTGTTIGPTPYTPKVSFDTFENPQASMFSFTLQTKSSGYKRTRTTRVYLCAAGPDESGQKALDWALESLVQDGDELIVFRGVDEEVMEKDHNILREEARQLMRSVKEKSAEADPDRKLSLILEYIPGKITDSIDRLIALYRPDSLVVGTRGKRGIMSVGFGGIGSISKYCLSHSPVPVIVVRPERKLKKAAEKRKADPKRGRHFET